MRALPGVEHAAATCCVPLEGGFGLPFRIAGRALEDGPFHGGGGWTTVSDGFFEVFRIPTRRGRVFTDRDGNGAPPVVVINQTMADRYWPEADPLAGRLVIGRGVMQQFADEPERQIVGVVADVRDGKLDAEPQPRMIVLQGLRLIAAGVAIGAAAAAGLTRLIASFLFGVEASDPATFLAVPIVLTAVALAAVAVPAHRASRIDPVLALRGE